MAFEINSETIADAMAARLMDRTILVPRLLTLEQAATYLGLTKEALKSKVHLGRIPTVDLDKKLRFDREDLDRIIEQNKRVAKRWRNGLQSSVRDRSFFGTIGGGATTLPAGSAAASRARRRTAKRH